MKSQVARNFRMEMTNIKGEKEKRVCGVGWFFFVAETIFGQQCHLDGLKVKKYNGNDVSG